VPLQNRVTPFGEIIATEARGLLFGNRGHLHDDVGRIVRPWQVRRWIACLLEFKGRHRELLQPGRYTELFFLDEATAFAAGHRPCAECRREDFVRFRDAWAATHGGGPDSAVRVDDVDRVLHEERVGPGRSKRLHPARLGELPDGSMIAVEDRAWLVRGGALLEWSPAGYSGRRELSPGSAVLALTPPSIVEVFRSGYVPAVHPSATTC
jgi:hypothetical protein